MANERGNIDCGLRLAERSYIIRECWVAEEVAPTEQRHWIGRVSVETNRRGADAAVANDDGGNALRNLRKHFWGFDHAGVVMGVHINEAGREAEAFGFDNLGSGAAKRLANLNNAAVAQGDIESLSGVSAAVEHRRVAYERVVLQHLG